MFHSIPLLVCLLGVSATATAVAGVVVDRALLPGPLGVPLVAVANVVATAAKAVDGTVTPVGAVIVPQLTFAWYPNADMFGNDIRDANGNAIANTGGLASAAACESYCSNKPGFDSFFFSNAQNGNHCYCKTNNANVKLYFDYSGSSARYGTCDVATNAAFNGLYCETVSFVSGYCKVVATGAPCTESDPSKQIYD
ncbi:hypothetical protein RQP46_005168 [Phenoliferia psychrophenolica]